MQKKRKNEQKGFENGKSQRNIEKNSHRMINLLSLFKSSIGEVQLKTKTEKRKGRSTQFIYRFP
jgi:hypothetical protein